jgi:hypothetical protein
MSEHDLSALADLAAGLPSERRGQIEKQLPGLLNPRYEAGVAEGFARAAEIAGEQSEEVARSLREIAAVAAARAVEQRKLYDQARRQMDTPEARAEIEAELERILSGQAKMYSADEVIREMDDMIAAHNAGRPGG